MASTRSIATRPITEPRSAFFIISYKPLTSLSSDHFLLASISDASKASLIDAPAGTIAYRLKNYAGRDDWRDIIVILNANKAATEVNIPDGSYTIVCQNGVINEQGMGETTGCKVSVSPQSALIIHN